MHRAQGDAIRQQLEQRLDEATDAPGNAGDLTALGGIQAKSRDFLGTHPHPARHLRDDAAPIPAEAPVTNAQRET
ncbi:MAG: hypothetical protein JSS28_13195 [Proteobacteria bacterium]|nr:hypothetical protein [Pseudomonadota bacterium]